MQLKNSKKVTSKGTMGKQLHQIQQLPLPAAAAAASLNCPHQLQQIQQLHQQQQRCSSVGSTGSSTCDTMSSHSGSALSPTLPTGNGVVIVGGGGGGYAGKSIPTNATALASALSGEKMPNNASTTTLSTLSMRGMAASRMPLNASPSNTIYPLGGATATTALPLPPTLLPPAPPSSGGVGINVGRPPSNIGVSAAAAAMAAANLAESFTLLQQQAAHHFQDILYAAHLLGRGYYQPAGPLISPHVLPPVATGPPPTLTNVSLLPASTTPGTASGGSSKQKQHEIPTPLSSDPEHLHTAPSTTSAADSTDSDVLITGGDLTPFRYPASSATGTIPAHQHPTSQQQQQQHHQLHQQAAAAAAAHQGSPYPRAMHAAQMHYLTAYPPNYYAPYPGEAMCYSPPTAAYQPYFPTKVYQSGPPHPPPGAYRRYPYYQPGPPPADLYEAAPPPPPPQQTNSSSSSAQSTAGPQSTQSASQTVPTAPSQSGAGSQLVPAGPAAHAQHLEHYPGPPGYYSGYSPGNTAAGQCYTRTIQGPYMEYPPQCPCPMQQSCPKNVHTGPHIGSNNGNSNSHHTNGSSSSNSSSSSNNTNTPIITSISGSNTTAMNHNNSNSSSNSIVTGSQSSNSIGKTTSNTTSSTPMNVNNSSNNSNSCNSMMNTVTTNRGPVKNLLSEQQRQQPQQQQQRETAQFLNSFHQEDLLKTSVKSEMKTEETDCKSQYEDHVVQPPTPPESYGTNDDKSLLIDDDIMDEAMEKLEMARLSAVAATAAATLPTSTLSTQPEQQNDSAITSPTSPSPDIIVPTNIEAYDLTKTTSPPLNSIQTTNACSSSNSINQNSGLVPSNTQITQPTLVGRKARIGKTMAREMVYAAAATTTVSQQQQQQQQQLQMRNTTQQSSTVPIAITTTTTTTTPTISTATTVATTTTTTSSSPTAILALPFLATIKTEIKAEHIKLEDDIMDTILRQQHINNTDSSSYNDHNELKIKAEPLSTFDGETNSSHNTVFDILSRYHQSGQEEIARITPHPFRQDSFDDVDGSASITMPKPINEGRMRLAPNWQQSPKINCEIDLSMASDDDVLDLRQSPLPGDANSSKRIKILDFHNTSSGACKKSSPNSYKNLIKQAEPKAYLCLSRRRIDKRNRYSIIQRKAMTNGSFLNVRRRHVVLTEQQKERLKLRRKKLIALERKRQEALDRKRAAFRRRRLEAKQAEKAARAEENLLKTEKTEEDEEQNVLEIVQQQQRVSEKPSMTAINEVQSMSTNSIHQRTSVTPKASPKHAPKPKKVSAIPLHLIEASDAMARGYFSEPETRCSSVLGGSKYGCEMMVETNGTRTTPLSVAATKSALAEISCRKQKKTKISIAEKRSKSETKKPIKSSTNLQTFLTPDLLYTQAQKQEFSRSEVSSMNVNNLITSTSNSPDETATTKTTVEDTSLSTLWNGDAVTTTKSTSKKHGKSKKHKESKSKSTKNATKTSKNIKSTKSKSSKHNKKYKSFSDDAVKSTINDALPPISRESHNDDGNGDEDLTESIENMDQSIPRETNNNEIIEKSTTIVDIPSQTSSAEKLISKCEIESKSLASQAAENQIESAQLPHATDTAAAIAVPVAAAAVAQQHQQQHQQAENLQHQHTSLAAVTSSSHSDKNQLFLQPALPPRILCHSHHFHGKRTRSRAKFGPRKRQKQKHSTVSYELDERPPPALRGDAIPKWNNGWTWDGEPFQGAVFLNSDDPLVIRTCYAAMRHSEGDIIRTRDCVLLKANEDDELPYVAKVAHLWENPEDGEMMVSLLWYYRPEHTEQGRQPNDSPDEVYASRHRDHNSVACIEDKCYVLTFSEYCRYRRRLRANEEEIEDVSIVPKPASSFYCAQKVPDNTNPELVMFCHRAYEFRSKRLLKMPNKQDYYVVNN